MLLSRPRRIIPYVANAITEKFRQIYILRSWLNKSGKSYKTIKRGINTKATTDQQTQTHNYNNRNETRISVRMGGQIENSLFGTSTLHINISQHSITQHSSLLENKIIKPTLFQCVSLMTQNHFLPLIVVKSLSASKFFPVPLSSRSGAKRAVARKRDHSVCFSHFSKRLIISD